MDKFTKDIISLNEYIENNIPTSLEECENTFKKYKTNGFAGHVPDFLKTLIPNNKTEKDFLFIFNEFILLCEKNKLTQACSNLNEFFDNKIIFSVQKNIYKGRHIRFGLILQNNINDEALFVKVFKKDYKKQNIFHHRNGPFVETNVGLFITKNLKDSPYFAKVYFSNVEKMYIVSEYVKSCLDYKDELEKSKIRETKDQTEKRKKFVEFLERLTNKKINHYEMIKSIKNGCFRHLDIQTDNFIIYEDKNKEKSVKLVDYGYFISYNQELKTV